MVAVIVTRAVRGQHPCRRRRIRAGWCHRHRTRFRPVHRDSGSRGIVTGDEDLESEGKADRRLGEAEGKIDHAKDRADEVIDKTRDMVDDAIDKAKDALHPK